MKINDSTGKLSPAAPISERNVTAEAASIGSPARLSTEQVSLSGPARALLSGESAPVDDGKVTQIRQQIADGSYRIDSAEIADRLITAARELFSRRH